MALTREGFSVGTPTYMAPEQIRGEKIGPPTDLYALGVTAWYALEARSGAGNVRLRRKTRPTAAAATNPSTTPSATGRPGRNFSPSNSARIAPAPMASVSRLVPGTCWTS